MDVDGRSYCGKYGVPGMHRGTNYAEFAMMKWTIPFLLFVTAVATAEEQDSVHSVLTVSADGQVKVRARIADVRLSVQVDGRSAVEVQQSLARLSGPVIESLRALKADQVEGGDMMIYPQYGKDNPTVIMGYRGQSSIHFSAPADHAGELIDAAISAGANQLQNVSLRADPDDLAEARRQALKDAAQAALREAKTVLDALGLEQKAIDRVTVNAAGGGGPIYPALYRVTAMADHRESNTQVLEQEQDVTASLTLRILYGQGRDRS